MNKRFRPPVPLMRFVCVLTGVVLLHVFMGCVLVSSVPRKALRPMRKPVEAVLVQPPQTLPRSSLRKSQVLASAQAPRAGITQPPALPSAETVPPMSTQAPATQSVAPPAPSGLVSAASLPSAPTETGPPQVGITLVCPTQVAPEMPRRAIKEGIEGVVRAQIHVKGKRIVDVTLLSGPRIFHAAVREAMLQYNCMTDGGEVIATQEFNFKLE
ncbi:MAG: hypothetical protein RLZZ371_1384 [Pseudomonadota bacterium]